MGETWQFLRLDNQAAMLNKDRYYLDNVAGILSVLHAIYQDPSDADGDVR